MSCVLSGFGAHFMALLSGFGAHFSAGAGGRPDVMRFDGVTSSSKFVAI
jgi:hypothetical protein